LERQRDLGECDGACTESTDSETSCNTTTIRKPLLKGRDRGNIAETESRTANDTISKVDKANKLEHAIE